MSAPGLPAEMRAQKAWRVAGLALQGAGLAVQAARRTGCNHLAVQVARGTRQATITLSSSPRDPDHMAAAAVRDARRRLGASR